MRYTITADGLLIMGSEAGMVPVRETEIIEKGRLGPGQMIAVDLHEEAADAELKQQLAVTTLRRLGPEYDANRRCNPSVQAANAEYSNTELRRRQVAAGTLLRS